MAESIRKQPNIGLKPSVGKLTFEAEGTEGGAYHSRKLHVPDKKSGVTIGRGYDMKKRDPAVIINDLTSAGIPKDQAVKLSKAAGLSGAKAQKFIADNKMGSYEISSQSQTTLFNKSYDEAYKDVMRIFAKPDTVKKYGKVDLKVANPAIVELTVDLRFRGDYSPKTREFIQRPIVSNDLKAVQKAISNRNNWPDVPADRFNRRVKYMTEAVLAAEKARPVVQAAAKKVQAPQITPQAKSVVAPAHSPSRTISTVARPPAKR